jgi:hypothetical protein
MCPPATVLLPVTIEDAFLSAMEPLLLALSLLAQSMTEAPLVVMLLLAARIISADDLSNIVPVVPPATVFRFSLILMLPP